MHVLVARLDNDGDVLLTGPAVRAIAAGGGEVTYLCSPRARSAAALLVGVHRIVTFEAPWIAADPPPVDTDATARLVELVREVAPNEAFVLTSFHQSPLPLALLLRLAGVERIAAISVDYPGSLLDVRHHVPDDVHEVERNLSLVATLGYHLPLDDDGRLRIQLDDGPAADPLPVRYVVVHPGASVPSRALPTPLAAGAVAALVEDGYDVVVTGSDADRDGAALTGHGITNLVGRTDLAGLAKVLAGGDALIVGNTGPAHVAAAVGTPVVSVFAPTVPAERWHPWGVPYVLLGDQSIGCAGCRSRRCPIAHQLCTAAVGVEEVLAAVHEVARKDMAVA